MDTQFLEQFRKGISQTRHNLSEWLRTTPESKKRINLGLAEERAVEDRLQVLDQTLQKTEDNSLGICNVCHEEIEKELLEMDYTSCVCLTHLSDEETRRLESELELAQTVQQSLLPHQVPDIPSLEIAAFSRPAQYIGGDYFDFFPFQNGAQGLLIADVAGHGISASLHMASLQTLLRSLVPVNDSPEKVVEKMHQLLTHNIRYTTFVTIFLGAFYPETHMLNYANAGHNPPLLFRSRSNGKPGVDWLKPTGPALGLVEQPFSSDQNVHLQLGDILVMYTDGITEAFNDHRQQFGSDRLEGLVNTAGQLPSKEIVHRILEDLQSFTDGRALEDDATLVVCKIVS
jgi:sigma-B regulation protein RsbU (phosphoserine phosphatase)